MANDHVVIVVKFADGQSERILVAPGDLDDRLLWLMLGGDWFEDGEGHWVRIVEIAVETPADEALREEMLSSLKKFHVAHSHIRGPVFLGFGPPSS